MKTYRLRINILNIIPKFPINPNNTVVGGSASALFNLSKALVEKGCSTEILSHYPLVSPNDLKKITGETGIIFSSLNINAPSISKKYGMAFSIKLWNKSFEYNNHLDIIHGHSGHIDYLLPMKIFSILKRKPLVYSLYCPINFESSIVKYPLRESLIKLLLRDVRLIVISKNIYESLSSLIPEENISIIPPSIDVDKFSPSLNKRLIRKKYAYIIGQPIILFVGNFSRNKNLECALFALAGIKKQFPRVKLIIMTELDHSKYSERETYLKNIINDLELSNNITFLGIIDTMAEVMKLSDILIAPFVDSDGPSDYFIAALEAMAVGTPVIVSDKGGMKEVINQDNGILLPPDQPNLWAKRIIHLLTNQDYYNLIAHNATKYIPNHFHPQLAANRTISVYEEILNDGIR